jgi:HK97 family phage portal protein
MAFWDIFRKKSADNLTLNNAIRQQCEFIRPELGSSYTDSNSVNDYRSWVYVASSYNARAVASAEVELYTTVPAKVARTTKISQKQAKKVKSLSQKSMRDVQRVEDHPILDLMHKPNDNDNLYSFLYRCDIFLELTGDAYILLTKDANGIPQQMDLLYSQYVNIQTDGRNKVIGYNYGIAQDGKYQYSFTPDEICHIKFFDPSDLLYGISPLEACARSYGLIESMDTYEEAINRNMGVVSGILKQTGKVKPEQRAEFEAKWQRKFSGVGRSGKVVVTDADIDYQNIGIAPRDMQFLDGREWSRTEILACYGVSPALLMTDDVNRSNMITASVNYYHNTVEPRLRLISQSITNHVLNQNGIDGKNLFITLERDTPEDVEVSLQKATLLSANGALTINELRVMVGEPPLEGPLGEEIINRSPLGDI